MKTAIRPFLREHRFDILFLALSAVFFSMFIYQSINFKALSGVGGSIAKMLSGAAERKASGDSTYEMIEAPKELNNMDAIWVGKGGNATIGMLDSNAQLELSEKTFILLKLPFKKSRNAEDALKVLKGKVKVKKALQKDIEVSNTSLVDVPLPKYEKKPVDRKVPQGLFPRDDYILFMRPEKTVTIVFTWPEAATGFLVVQNQNTGRATYTEVKGEKFAKATLDQNNTYFWQIIDQKRKILAGPFKFDLKLLDPQSQKGALSFDGKRPVEVYWDNAESYGIDSVAH